MRKITIRLYLIAGVITLVIFILGILLGVSIETQRVEYIKSKDQEQKIDFDSSQLQYLYLSYLSAAKRNESCLAFSTTLDRYIKKTDETRIRLENYLENSNVHTKEFKLLKKDFIISSGITDESKKIIFKKITVERYNLYLLLFIEKTLDIEKIEKNLPNFSKNLIDLIHTYI